MSTAQPVDERTFFCFMQSFSMSRIFCTKVMPVSRQSRSLCQPTSCRQGAHKPGTVPSIPAICLMLIKMHLKPARSSWSVPITRQRERCRHVNDQRARADFVLSTHLEVFVLQSRDHIQAIQIPHNVVVLPRTRTYIDHASNLTCSPNTHHSMIAGTGTSDLSIRSSFTPSSVSSTMRMR